MKLDNYFSSIYLCPTTKTQITDTNVMHSHGVCRVCGHNNKCTVTHWTAEAGRWNRPSILEWFKGSRKKWVPK